MLFVFQVETGRMMTFDMSLALESVEILKTHIEKVCRIEPDHQVLLISGGEHLVPDARICSYPAGTDTNPIFLFSKTNGNKDVEVLKACFEHTPETDLEPKIRECADLPATLTTVQKRTQLAQDFVDCDKAIIRFCENLVHEQHLQHQGWAAVVANLEDLSVALRQRWIHYEEIFDEYIKDRNSYLEFLQHFKDDLLILQKIPVLPALLETHKLHVPDDPSCDECSTGDMSLFQWINQQDDFMDYLYDVCTKGLTQTDERLFVSLHSEVEKTLHLPDEHGMKEIKGLGERLYGLEKLMVDARIIMQEQEDLSKSFQRNNTRASQVKEASVLPDLCLTHIQQLNHMTDNHRKMREIMRRCTAAKSELTDNLVLRLSWVVFLEQTFSEVDNKLVFSFQNLLTLQRQLEILQQLHTAPAMYFSAVAEVVRRRKFSQAFLLWASDVACHLLTIYNEELSRRKDFQFQFEAHFLSSLFPGMEDLPPSFATQAPSLFDTSLPRISQEDIERLRTAIPELAGSLNIADSTMALNFFSQDLKEDKKDENRAVEEKIMEVVAKAGLASTLDQNLLKAIAEPQLTAHGLPNLKDVDKGCESETDTEEFEKVSQSPFELHFDKGIPSPRPGTQDASTLTEDNLQVSQSEYEKLKSVLLRLSQLAKQTHNQLRTELTEVKDHLFHCKITADEDKLVLVQAFKNLIAERDNRERETVQRLTVDHELEISDFRKIAQGKNEEIKILRDDTARLEGQLKARASENCELSKQVGEISLEKRRVVESLEKKLEDLHLETEKNIKDVTDKLKCEHRGEIENIRARFKLMTMERSPSENSLEKIDRGEFTSLTNPEALLLQMTENFESEKEVAVSDAITKESQKWHKVIEDKVKELEDKFERERVTAIEQTEKRVIEDREKQLIAVMNDVKQLTLENMKYKNTLRQLTENREECNHSDLVNQIESLESEKRLLESEMENMRSSREMGMAASVAVCEGMVDATTSPIKSKRRSEVSLRSGRLCTDSCKPGDLVLVMWDVAFQNFKILQDSAYMFFLNTDCMENIGLKISDGQPNKPYCYAEVVEKEYCHARKPVNRFKVPQGTKFFRVKVKAPIVAKEAPPFCQPTAPVQMTQSQTTPVVEVAGNEGSSSLPSSPSKDGDWDKSELAQSTAIPEEKGEDSITHENDVSENIEKGTELTEFFSLETHSSIDR